MIFIGLGSNLGNREEYLAQARTALVMHDIDITAMSSIHETAALVPPGAPQTWNVPYLNQVIAVDTHHAPEDLLACLKLIEADLGRTPRERWAPREIDLDLLGYGDVILITDHLTVPHPQLDTREFVLKPLAEIAPDWQHPIFGKTARELLAELVT